MKSSEKNKLTTRLPDHPKNIGESETKKKSSPQSSESCIFCNKDILLFVIFVVNNSLKTD